MRRSITLSHESRAIMNYAIGFCITGNRGARDVSRGELVTLTRGSYTIIWETELLLYARIHYGKMMARAALPLDAGYIVPRLMKIRYIIRNFFLVRAKLSKRPRYSLRI